MLDSVTVGATSRLGAGEIDHSYARLPARFFARVAPTRVREPRLVVWNDSLAHLLGLDEASHEAAEWADILAGNAVPSWAEPIAMAYAGHQFGAFVPQLGDGRAILLAEVIGRDGRRRDLQLKGGGRTPYSRAGDGRAALGPALREYLISEAMHALGIATTRSLAVVRTGEVIARDRWLPGAVLARVASSHLRIGTFEYFAARGDREAVRILADYAIDRHYPELKSHAEPYLDLLRAVCDRQASLVARWLEVGFVHGVMNTDNTSIAGETIDYGPCAFMDAFDPGTVFSSIDQQGRYAFGNQPRIALWNLTRFAETLLPLLHDEEDRAVAIASEVLERMPEEFARAWRDCMRRKLGLVTQRTGDDALIDALLEQMQAVSADYTNTFRRLGEIAEQGAPPPGLEDFVARWRARLGEESRSPAAAAESMRACNPAVIPRNHRVEAALAAAVDGDDLGPLRALLGVLSKPFDLPEELAHFAQPAPADAPPYRTFCGT